MNGDRDRDTAREESKSGDRYVNRARDGDEPKASSRARSPTRARSPFRARVLARTGDAVSP